MAYLCCFKEGEKSLLFWFWFSFAKVLSNIERVFMENFVELVCIGTFVLAIVFSIISLVGSCFGSYVNSAFSRLISFMNTICWSFVFCFPCLSMFIPFVQDFFGFAVACVYVAMIMGMVLFIGVGIYEIEIKGNIEEICPILADCKTDLSKKAPTRDFGEVVMIFIIIFFAIILFAMTPFGELAKSAILEILERRL